MINRKDPCFCESGRKWKDCCFPQKQKSHFRKNNILIKTPFEILKIREACIISKKILHILCSNAKEGVTTEHLDTLSRKLHKQYNVSPAPLGYGSPPFPATICTSVNDVMCHGIPNEIPLKKGDIINIDVSCIKDGFFGDCSDMVIIGDNTSQKSTALIETVRKSLDESIKICKPKTPFSVIGNKIQEICDEANFSISKDFVGHGVGIKFHESPAILHYANEDTETIMMPGMIFTIEPIVNAGSGEHYIEKDQWTTRTIDGKNSAQVEDTILITENSYEVLTKHID